MRGPKPPAVELTANERRQLEALIRRHTTQYIRHGTRSFILNPDVLTGQIIAPSDGPTRTERDFLAHIQRTIATDPATTRWHFVLDNLDIHRSESLVRFVAAASGLEIELGVKSKSGILKSRQTRAAFLSAAGWSRPATGPAFAADCSRSQRSPLDHDSTAKYEDTLTATPRQI
jgi:hypothetical protein